MTDSIHSDRVDTPASTRRRAWIAVWLPGLAVAVGAAVATAHGLYEVAVAARVPAGIAWIYPLITDGLALVAYAATARLSGSAARYAWSVVIIAAGLSGIAQASYLASDATTEGGELTVSAALRFGVGAWPAVAAAVVAHLLYLLAADRRATMDSVPPEGQDGPGVPVSLAVPRTTGTPCPRSVTGDPVPSVPHALDGPVITASRPSVSHHEPDSDGTETDASGAPARDHAQVVADQYRVRHGALPTVRELQNLADVSRGTAARALTRLREAPQTVDTDLHPVPDDTDTRTQP